MSIWGAQLSYQTGRSQTQPAFAAAGAGASSAGAGVNVAYPSGIIAGSILLLHMHAIDSAAPAMVTPAGWTLVTSTTVGAGPQVAEATYIKIADGTESGTLAPGWTADTQQAGRMYRFTGSCAGTEGASASAAAGSNASILTGSVTTTGVLELAVVCFCGVANTTIGDVSGEVGGDYTEAVAEYNTTTGGNLTMQLQTAVMATAGTINSGTATFGAAATNRFTHRFAIVS